MNWVDLVIIGVFLVYLYEGYQRGFVEQSLELIGFFITILIAFWSYQSVANWMVPHLGIGQISAAPVAFLVDWIIFQILYSFLLHFINPFLPDSLRGSKVNKVTGVIPAWLKAYAVISMIIALIVVLPTASQLKNEVSDSFIGKVFVNQSPKIEASLNKLFGRDVGQSLSFLTVPPQNEQIIQPDERVDLGFTTKNTSTDYAAEQKMLKDVNNVRAQNGLEPLIWDEDLAKVARAHSTDMFVKGYFSHQSNNGDTPFDRMTAAGIKYSSAGENIAFAATETLAFNGLMNSPGHRANILEKSFGHIGIGVISGGAYGEMFTQDFSN